jgi:hypothetical protein
MAAGSRSRRETWLVVTVSHCLPSLREPHPLADHSRTWPLLVPLGATDPSVVAECVFCDPVADIAVLGLPDEQAADAAAQQYRELVHAVKPLIVGPVSPMTFNAWMLSLDGEWFASETGYNGEYGLWTTKPTKPVMPSMSGSPILFGC